MSVVTDATTIDGFTIAGGNAHGDHGGGMLNEKGSPTVTNVIFADNNADNGGGISNKGGNPQMTRVEFRNNTASGHGGGMFNGGDGRPELTDVAFSENHAGFYGGGMSNWGGSPTLKDVEFVENTTPGRGGGMSNYEGGALELTNVKFIGNTARIGGGLNHQASSTITMTQVLFNGNSADGGGAIESVESDGAIVNATVVHNSGGGIRCDSSPGLRVSNSVLWGNTHWLPGLSTHDSQLENCSDSTSEIQDNASDPWPFVDHDGADNVPGNEDDNLYPGYRAGDIVDGGKDDDIFDNVEDVEDVKDDLGGRPRIYSDYDLDGTNDGDVGNGYQVDRGAFEAGCFAWHMHYGDSKLAEGRKFREGFHAEVDGDALIKYEDLRRKYEDLPDYAAGTGRNSLQEAKLAYEISLGCAGSNKGKKQALLGIYNATWELATAALLRGNEKLVEAMDLTDDKVIQGEKALIIEALGYYHKASDGYLKLLTSDQFANFLASQPTRVDPLTHKVNPYLDVKRLAASLAKESRAYLELAERQFRNEETAKAAQTLRVGRNRAAVAMALVVDLWGGIVDEDDYQELLRNLSDMHRLHAFVAEGKNPLGYTPDYVPIHYDPREPKKNNYEQTHELAHDSLVAAGTAVDEAGEKSEALHDNYINMQDAYQAIDSEYGDELERLCGVEGNEPDLVHCTGGTIAQQFSAVNAANLRLSRVLEEQNVLHKQIELEVEYRAKTAGIYQNTAKLVDPDTSERFSSLDEQKDWLTEGIEIVKGVKDIGSAFVSGFGGREAFGKDKKGSVGGGLFEALGPLGDMIGGFFGGGGPSREEQLLEYQAWQNAQVLICNGKIKDLEFEKKIKELFLEFGLLEIDFLTALENLHQELLRLDAMKTRVEYLMAEQAKAEAFTALLYQDPGYRVVRDRYMEQAQHRYDEALDYTFQAGRALEYEANLTWSELHAPDPDATFSVREMSTLTNRLQDTNREYNAWTADKNPNSYETGAPYNPLYLSTALGFGPGNTVIPGIGTVTPQEQFNAWVRDPANRYDLDGDGVAESLYFTFMTSIHKGNPFFDHCLFNDRIVSVKMRVRGKNLGKNSVNVRLGWGDVDCSDTQCGTTLMRSENAFTKPDGHGGYLDDLRAYPIQPKLATIAAVANDIAFPAGAENTDLATRSVSNSYWTLLIDMSDDKGPNAGFNLDNVDEIELIIEHAAYTLQAPMCQGPSAAATPVPPTYQPMQTVLDPALLTRSTRHAVSGEESVQAAATSLTGFYAGSVVVSSPAYMPSLDLNVMLLQDAGGQLSGYLDTDHSLDYPGKDGKGPALSGEWSGTSMPRLETESFQSTLGSDQSTLDSDQSTLDSDIIVTRRVLLQNGVIGDDGEILSGDYSETVEGLTPDPLKITGTFELYRSPKQLEPDAKFRAYPCTGAAPLAVSFSDQSTGNSTSWNWDFGDGSKSTEQYPMHTYNKPGKYTVKLVAGNGFGSDQVVQADYIDVTAETIAADFSASPRSGAAPLTVKFTDQSTGNPTGWSWDFGDGAKSTRQNPAHTFEEPGAYTVKLTCTGPMGSASHSMQILATDGEEILYMPFVSERDESPQVLYIQRPVGDERIHLPVVRR